MSEQDRFKKALEQSRKGETIDLSEEEFELFSAIQADGVTRAFQKDRPDREKIACLICGNDLCNHKPLEPPPKDFPIICPGNLDKADQIIALFPDYKTYISRLISDHQEAISNLRIEIEEVKHEERERIIDLVETYMWFHNDDASCGLKTGSTKFTKHWQALKEEKEGRL